MYWLLEFNHQLKLYSKAIDIIMSIINYVKNPFIFAVIHKRTNIYNYYSIISTILFTNYILSLPFARQKVYAYRLSFQSLIN